MFEHYWSSKTIQCCTEVLNTQYDRFFNIISFDFYKNILIFIENKKITRKKTP